MPSYQYRKSHCGDKTVVRSSHLHNGISCTGKMTSLYWIKAQMPNKIPYCSVKFACRPYRLCSYHSIWKNMMTPARQFWIFYVSNSIYSEGERFCYQKNDKTIYLNNPFCGLLSTIVSHKWLNNRVLFNFLFISTPCPDSLVNKAAWISRYQTSDFKHWWVSGCIHGRLWSTEIYVLCVDCADILNGTIVTSVIED